MKETFRHWFDRSKKQIASRPAIWIAAVMIAGFLAYYLDMNAAAPGIHTPEDVETAATYIPAGYVLVPIEVANFESLDSILGKFGVVDLYLPADDIHKRPFKIAERVRILRAPLNPSHFAVLVTEAQSPQLVTRTGPFLVVVQPSEGSGTKLVNPTVENPRTRNHRPRSRIEIEEAPVHAEDF